MQWRTRTDGLVHQNNKLKILLSQSILNSSVQIDKFKRENQSVLEENFVLRQTVMTLESKLEMERGRDNGYGNGRQSQLLRREKMMVRELEIKVEELNQLVRQKENRIQELEGKEKEKEKENMRRLSQLSNILPLESCIQNIQPVKQKEFIFQSWKGRSQQNPINIYVPRVASVSDHLSFETHITRPLPYTPKQVKQCPNNDFNLFRRKESSPFQGRIKTDRFRMTTDYQCSPTNSRGNFAGRNLITSSKDQRATEPVRRHQKQLSKLQDSKISKVDLTKIEQQLQGLANQMKLEFKQPNRIR